MLAGAAPCVVDAYLPPNKRGCRREEKAVPAGAGGLLKAPSDGVGWLLEGGQSGATSGSRRGKVRLQS